MDHSARETNNVSIAAGTGQDRTGSRNKRFSLKPDPRQKTMEKCPQKKSIFSAKQNWKNDHPSQSRPLEQALHKVSG